MLLALLSDNTDAFTQVLGYLSVKECCRLCCVNQQFRKDLDGGHCIWAQHAGILLGDETITTTIIPAEEESFDWKLALTLFYKRDPDQVKEPLLKLIDAVASRKAKRSVVCNGTIDTDCDPSFFVPTAGMALNLPLASSKLQKLIDGGVCERAPFGHGTETIVDLKTRNCWRLMLGKDVIQVNSAFQKLLNLSSADPNAPLSLVKEKMMPHLFSEGGGVCAQPYCMLIYEEGSFFTPHRDTLRGENHFGSLVVSLPVDSDCEGGELVVSVGSATTSITSTEKHHTSKKKAKTEIAHAPPAKDDPCKFHAFFTDVYHEVKPVTKGYRVALTYHLWVYRPEVNIVQQPKLPFDGNIRLQSLVLRRILETFFKNVSSTEYRFVLALDHSYSRRNLTKACMRGRDRILYEVLMDIISESDDMEGKLNLLSVQKFDKRDDNIELNLVVEQEYDGWKEDNDGISTKTIWMNRERFLAMEHTVSEYQYHTGNEGYATDFKYDHACFIIQHHDFQED